MDVGALVKQARWGTELSQGQLARRLGVPQSTLSRYESGSALPSLRMLDRILAACGKDVVFRLVQRHADLDDELDRRAALTLHQRLQGVAVLTPYFLGELAALPCVLVGGAWAAVAHGIPTDHVRGRLLVAGDEPSLAALSAFLRPRHLLFLEDGHWRGSSVPPGMLRDNPVATWRVDLVGDVETVVVPAGGRWPQEVRVDLEGRPLRVVAPDHLTEDDGVRSEVLERWLLREAGRRG